MSEVSDGNPQIREIGMGDLRAEPGKFRAVAIFDSCHYRVGDDASDVMTAIMLAHQAEKRGGMCIQVYDDLGHPRMKGRTD